MNKSETYHTLVVKPRQPHKKSALLKPYRFLQLYQNFPSPQQTHRRDQYLQKLHKWRQESRLSKLQQTYDQNCRIFISLKSQKSQYRLPKKPAAQKPSYLRLVPLTERNHQLPALSERSLSRHNLPRTMVQPSWSGREQT